MYEALLRMAWKVLVPLVQDHGHRVVIKQAMELIKDCTEYMQQANVKVVRAN